jgi:NADP-dependent 3-hydroxy acid dehydrogenase YdfG
MATTEKKVVLVTGVSSGFGQAIAAELDTRGYRVFGTTRQQPAAAGLGDSGSR